MLWSASSSAWKRTPPMEEDSRLIFSTLRPALVLEPQRPEESERGTAAWPVRALAGAIGARSPRVRWTSQSQASRNSGPHGPHGRARGKPPAMGRRLRNVTFSRRRLILPTRHLRERRALPFRRLPQDRRFPIAPLLRGTRRPRRGIYSASIFPSEEINRSAALFAHHDDDDDGCDDCLRLDKQLARGRSGLVTPPD